ncbi:MAG: UDP-glucose 4-epimerase GalE [Candidatus Marinimicrobia bacterium]|jgi:UDP-glucose 4-epimerase|nr:UDP-glucose 4-epimerase GalE [Candidatus Neomarinimicrobiota bacterium]MDP6499501.1 UDP-glucose 4-epimerase GalE [Candidatus Neomarinimicrobiota bacterium]MDP6726971.1 UDP-glucose 4-epimerase GalE [Candidatus Neomarinimicrobiota bacterium]|tara:strand:+ start:171 stop:1148 length:978 start_codon:yes stop_codon:yes gene_type:complete
MKVLVTGGAGYIGSHVVLDLVEAGHEVVILDDLSLGCRENVNGSAQFVLGSTLNTDDLDSALSEGINAVVHLAAFKAAGESMVDPDKYSLNNLNGTSNLLNAMMKHNVKTFVFSSTAAVYGYPEYLPVDEDHPLKPINYYGFTKLVIEQKLEWYHQLKGLKYAALRYFNAAGYDVQGRVSGLEKSPQNLLPIVMEVAKGQRSSMDVYGDDYDTKDGTGVRDYIHVNDLSSAHVQTLDYLQENESLTVNLATGEGYSVKDVITEAENITGKPIAHNIVGRRPGDPAELIAASKAAGELLGWEAQYSDLNTLLKSMWNVYNPEVEHD